MNKFKPMLAGKIENLEDIKFPVLVSPKLDGIRCLIKDGIAVTRSLKPVPNKYIQSILSKVELEGFDGELMLKDKSLDFNTVQSSVMSFEGEPDFIFEVFDIHSNTLDGLGFSERFSILSHTIRKLYGKFPVELVPHFSINSIEELLQYEEIAVASGYEGVMVRNLDGPYKNGRSTTREGYLLKLKRFKDDEAEIVECVERLHNSNEATKNELGYTERSHAQAGMVPTNSLGAFKVRFGNKEFEIGTGYTEEMRQEFWRDRDKLIGKMVKFKYQDLSKYGVPRFPVFLGFRDERDMS